MVWCGLLRYFVVARCGFWADFMVLVRVDVFVCFFVCVRVYAWVDCSLCCSFALRWLVYLLIVLRAAFAGVWDFAVLAVWLLRLGCSTSLLVSLCRVCVGLIVYCVGLIVVFNF